VKQFLLYAAAFVAGGAVVAGLVLWLFARWGNRALAWWVRFWLGER
jgi:hypothetical protein